MRLTALAAAFAVSAAFSTGAAAGAAGDPVHGEQIYARCLACHALAYDRVGPRHCGLFWRRAGSVPGFDYSPAMKKSGIVWTAKTLDWFLVDPVGRIPGTTMTYAGVPEPKERADLIAYLKQANDSPACRKLRDANPSQPR